MDFIERDEIRQYFFSTSLSQETYNYAALVFSLILVSVAVSGKISFGNEPKKMSWVLGTFSGIVLSIVGIIYLLVKVTTYKDIFGYGANGPELFESTNDVSNMIFLFFGISNILDLAFGCMFYRDQLGLLTGWVHHTLFIWMSLSSTTGNGLFITTPPYASSFAFMCIEEIPTAILGLGSIFPSLRSDWGFGLTFIPTRVIFHGYFTSYAFYMYYQNIGLNIHIPVLYGLTFVMYASWAHGWIQMMLKKGKKKE